MRVSKRIPVSSFRMEMTFCLHSPYGSPPKNRLDKSFSDVIIYAVQPKGLFPSDSASGSVHLLSSGGSDSMHGHTKRMGVDAFRVSLSSAVSSSSQGSGTVTKTPNLFLNSQNSGSRNRARTNN